ncbi:MAG: dicarboxylate/amino acid:cation symporter [Clostridia bacterium]|nr:dicarboxylate/amino acid:cation symporter [Clostridia bacterium]
MKIEKQVHEIQLSYAAVDELSQKIREFLTVLKLPSKEVTRYCLAAEEILLSLIEDETTDRIVRLTLGRKFFTPYFSIETDGTSKNVFIKDKEEHSFFGDSFLQNLGLSPEYTYSDGKNEYSFKLKKKKINPFIIILIAFASAIAVGCLGLLFPENVKNGITDSFINPVYDAFLNVLSCIAGPMIFLSVAWGIYGIGDVATLKRVGKSVFLGYFLMLYMFVIIIAAAAGPLFNWNFASSISSANEFKAIFTMILQIFPHDIISPFADGNTLQIIFLAIIIGIALIFLGKKTDAIAIAIEQINHIIQFLTEFITKLVPFFIFIVLVKMIWTNTVDTFLGVWKLFAVFICSALVVAFLLVLITGIRYRTNPFSLIRKGLPTFFTAITTASSAAAFSVNIKASTEDFGINKSVVAFSIPLGMILFKVTTAISYLCLAYYFAEFYGIEVSISWFILVAFTVGILAMATPPIPGGAAIAYTILYTQFGIPIEAIALTLACDVFLDFISTGFDQFALPYALVNMTSRLNLVDKNKLKEKKERITKN